MSYNSHHFDERTNAVICANIEMVMKCEAIVLDCIKSFLMSCNRKGQKKNFEAFIQLIIKMRFNIDSASKLLPLLKDDYRFKTSVNILYRASLDDIINIYYLLGYVIVDNEDQVSLGNELDILHRDFLKSAIKIIEGEMDAARYHSELNDVPYIPNVGEQNWRDGLIHANAHLYDKTKGCWKSNKEIRSSTLGVFKPFFPTGNSFISESQKIEFIEKKKFKRHFVLTMLFKYFSQYQHFSPKMHAFLLTTADKDLEFYHKMLVEVLCTVSECNQILNTSNRQSNDESLNQAIKEVFALYNSFYDSITPEN